MGEFFNVMATKLNDAHSGAFLGWHREKRILPWDDGIDSGVDCRSRKAVLDFADYLKQQVTATAPNGYKSRR